MVYEEESHVGKSILTAAPRTHSKKEEPEAGTVRWQEWQAADPGGESSQDFTGREQ